MLILTRAVGKSIIIGNLGDEVIVTVLKVTGNDVRIGITAPPEISVDREEVRERKINDGVI